MTNEDEIRTMARVLDLVVPEECVPGVGANMQILRRHAGVIRAFDNPALGPAEFLAL